VTFWARTGSPAVKLTSKALPFVSTILTSTLRMRSTTSSIGAVRRAPPYRSNSVMMRSSLGRLSTSRRMASTRSSGPRVTVARTYDSGMRCGTMETIAVDR
jgi:hypothetical protein